MAITPINEYAISLPFSFNAFGGVTSATSQSKIWADRLRAALGTALGERLLRGNYGTEIPLTTFSTVSEMEEVILREVERVFTAQFPLLTLGEVTPTFDEKTSTINVQVLYQLPNQQDESVQIGLARISPDDPIVEELR
jgi:phage baseplate assembly protein W